MLPKTVLMMFSGAIWWWGAFMCQKLEFGQQQRVIVGNPEFQEPTENLRLLSCWSSSPCSMPPSLLQVRSKTVQIIIHLNIVDECRSNILAPLSFSLPSIQFEKKTTTIYILSFPRPFVRLGKVCKVWIWLHYCFLWLFRQWKVSKELVFFLIFITLQNLLAVHIYTLWYNFRSYVISTLIAVLFLPFGDQTCNEKQFQYWDWKIDIEFV